MADNHVRPKVDVFELKVVISNSDILAEIVSASVKEFMGMSRDEIKRYMDLDDTGTHVRFKNTEILSSGRGTFRVDSCFQLRMPGDGNLAQNVIVSIEGQIKSRLHYPLKNR